ncbi:MAG: hypothetical protein EOP14_00375 [Pseudomonas sp.]|nr:MAG: hypothetical protein EOP14_00375 [Pseudomonas sp.]
MANTERDIPLTEASKTKTLREELWTWRRSLEEASRGARIHLSTDLPILGLLRGLLPLRRRLKK